MLNATDLPALCRRRRWTRVKLVREMRDAAAVLQGRELPADATMLRMLRQWISGDRGLGVEYADIFSAIFNMPFETGKPFAKSPKTQTDDDLDAKLSAAKHVDTDLIRLLEGQTQTYRGMDRQLGAAKMLQQTTAHVEQMTDLWKYSIPGAQRETLASAVAEAAALAGWQALDLGDATKAWKLHEDAKSAAEESKSAAILAHVTAQQAYALLDVNRTAEAVTLIQHARQEADGRVPAVLRSWLWAAEAEALAADGQADDSRKALGYAAKALPGADEVEELPYLFLSNVHLARWRGHCHARLGLAEAVDELKSAIKALDPTFTRAAAGHHCDLALAYSMRGDHDAARAEAGIAEDLARQTASVRQRRRIKRLLRSGAGPTGR